MNQSVQHICHSIFTEIHKQPEAKLFWEIQKDLISNQIEYSIGLKLIKQKITGNEYKDISMFISDMMECFTSAQKSKFSSKIKIAAAQDLIKKFQVHIFEINNPSICFNFYPIFHSLNSFIQKNSIPYHQNTFSTHITTNSNPEIDQNSELELISTKPGSLFFQNESENDNFENFLRDIQFLTGAHLVFKFATFISRIQPEIIEMNENFSLNIRLMTPTNRKYAHKYLKKLLRDAALGIIDPFSRPFGEKHTPLRINQLGFLKERSSNNTTIILSFKQK